MIFRRNPRAPVVVSSHSHCPVGLWYCSGRVLSCGNEMSNVYAYLLNAPSGQTLAGLYGCSVPDVSVDGARQVAQSIGFYWGEWGGREICSEFADRAQAADAAVAVAAKWDAAFMAAGTMQRHDFEG